MTASRGALRRIVSWSATRDGAPVVVGCFERSRWPLAPAHVILVELGGCGVELTADQADELAAWITLSATRARQLDRGASGDAESSSRGNT